MYEEVCIGKNLCISYNIKELKVPLNHTNIFKSTFLQKYLLPLNAYRQANDFKEALLYLNVAKINVCLVNFVP